MLWQGMGEVTQSCLTLCDPMDYTVHWILQARILEWVAFPFSRGSSQPRDWTQVSLIAGRFFTNWTIREAHMLWGMCPIQCISQDIHWNIIHIQCCTHSGDYLWPLACIYLGHLCPCQPKAKLFPSLCQFLSLVYSSLIWVLSLGVSVQP